MATYIDWSKYGKAEPEITEECIGQTSLPYDECIGPTGSICYDDCPTGPTGQYNREDVKKRMEESCEDIAPIGITEPCGCDDGPCTEVPCPNYKGMPGHQARGVL